MIFCRQRLANLLHGETNMRDVDTPSSHARLMTVVVSPSLQSFMERRQCYMVRDYIRHIHIVPVKSHNTLEVHSINIDRTNRATSHLRI